MRAIGLKCIPALGIWLLAIVLLVLIERLSMPWHGLDRYLLSFAHDLSHFFWLDRFFTVITWAGSLFILAPVTVLVSMFLISNNRATDAALLSMSLVGAALLSRLAKIWFARPRPDLYPVIGDMPLDAAYPSAHTAQIFAFAVTLCWIMKQDKLGLGYYFFTGAALLLALLVSISRIYLQVHFPSDVLGGALLSLLWVLGLFNLLHNVNLR